MSTDLITVSPETSLLEAVRLIVENGISCLPVVEHGRAIGILTTTDLYLALEQLLCRLNGKTHRRFLHRNPMPRFNSREPDDIFISHRGGTRQQFTIGDDATSRGGIDSRQSHIK